MPVGVSDASTSERADTGMEESNDKTKNEEKLPLHEDVMQLARLGEIGPIQKLFDEGKCDGTYKDEEGVTPLHWAAINNHYALCKFLIESGADVNAKGGESVTTPAMWAVQRCHIYVVHMLLQHGADPLIVDVQGYNMLHLATFDGNVFIMLVLLHQHIPVDSPDPSGHTCLMWAAYKGYPACVELLLQWGASVNVKDEKGFTALHWALVKGNAYCIRKLIESGSDRFAETDDAKTPAIVAHEMKSKGPWHRSLKGLGYNADGTPKQLPLSYTSFVNTRIFHTRFFFFLPFFEIIIIMTILSRMVIYFAVPLAMFVLYSMQFAAQQVFPWAPNDMKQFDHTPYLAGVLAGSVFWVGLQWFTTILPYTFTTHVFCNVLFSACFFSCAYFFTISMIENPGYIPKLSSRTSQKAVIDELISLWKFDDQNYCVHCMIRMPLRSKHCRRCSRCVAKHDHHCPWINACVGANNHRHFLLFIISMEFGVLLFDRLVLYYLEGLPLPTEKSCNILSDGLCEYVLRDTFTVALTLWITLHLTWVSMLIFTHLFLISKAQTTWESMRGNGPHATRTSEAVTATLTSGSTTMDGAQISDASRGSTASRGAQPHRPRQGCFDQWKKLLGLDSFVATASGKATKRRNPFSRGVVTNCKDFWCDSAPYLTMRENGTGTLDGASVNYVMMYEPPSRQRTRRDGSGHAYHNVDAEDNV